MKIEFPELENVSIKRRESLEHRWWSVVDLLIQENGKINVKHAHWVLKLRGVGFEDRKILLAHMRQKGSVELKWAGASYILVPVAFLAADSRVRIRGKSLEKNDLASLKYEPRKRKPRLKNRNNKNLHD